MLVGQADLMKRLGSGDVAKIAFDAMQQNPDI